MWKGICAPSSSCRASMILRSPILSWRDFANLLVRLSGLPTPRRWYILWEANQFAKSLVTFNHPFHLPPQLCPINSTRFIFLDHYILLRKGGPLPACIFSQENTWLGPLCDLLPDFKLQWIYSFHVFGHSVKPFVSIYSLHTTTRILRLKLTPKVLRWASVVRLFSSTWILRLKLKVLSCEPGIRFLCCYWGGIFSWQICSCWFVACNLFCTSCVIVQLHLGGSAALWILVRTCVHDWSRGYERWLLAYYLFRIDQLDTSNTPK